jgi:hypothetical protein
MLSGHPPEIIRKHSRDHGAHVVARALKNSQLTDGESHAIYGTGH